VADELWRLDVDRSVCQGTGMCSSIAAQHFRLREGYSEPIQDEVEPDDEIVDAAESCPVEAITVTSTADGRVVAPEPY
jgi:ferredoxin